MTILNTSDHLTNAYGTRYTRKYIDAAKQRRLYDQLALSVGAPQFDLETRRGMGETYTFNFLSDMEPGVTAISESADITPQDLQDATSTITPTSLGEALKWSQLVDLQVYTDFVAKRAGIVGENAMESIEVLAIAAALQGGLVDRSSARADLDAGTAADRWTDAYFWRAATMLKDLRCPQFVDSKGRSMHVAIAHTDAYYDLFSGGNIISAATYQDIDIILKGEVGEVAGFKIIASPFAKVFGGAGADNGTGAANSAYTLSAAATALDKTLSVSTGTNVAYGRMLTVGTEETANTFYPKNERVRRTSGTTTLVFVGSGSNDGVRFGHTTSEYVSNNDSVYPVAYGGPQSLVKIFANEVGEFGELVGPKKDGLVDQWTSLGWKFFGGYGRYAENTILRGEYSSSLDA